MSPRVIPDSFTTSPIRPGQGGAEPQPCGPLSSRLLSSPPAASIRRRAEAKPAPRRRPPTVGIELPTVVSRARARRAKPRARATQTALVAQSASRHVFIKRPERRDARRCLRAPALRSCSAGRRRRRRPHGRWTLGIPCTAPRSPPSPVIDPERRAKSGTPWATRNPTLMLRLPGSFLLR